MIFSEVDNSSILYFIHTFWWAIDVYNYVYSEFLNQNRWAPSWKNNCYCSFSFVWTIQFGPSSFWRFNRSLLLIWIAHFQKTAHFGSRPPTISRVESRHLMDVTRTLLDLVFALTLLWEYFDVQKPCKHLFRNRIQSRVVRQLVITCNCFVNFTILS